MKNTVGQRLMYKSARDMQDLETELRVAPEIAHLVPRLSLGKTANLSYDRIRDKEVHVMRFVAGILGEPVLLRNTDAIAFFGLGRFYAKIKG